MRIAEGVAYEGGVGLERDAMGRRKVWCPMRGCKGEGWVRKEDWEWDEEEDEEDEKRVEREMGIEEKVSWSEIESVRKRTSTDDR